MIGGELKKVDVNEFRDLTKLDYVGAYPSYAEAWNDLAIGYEQMGNFTEARKAYDTALKIDPKNQYILQNYDAFREIYDRQNRRRDR